MVRVRGGVSGRVRVTVRARASLTWRVEEAWRVAQGLPETILSLSIT